MNLLNKFKYTFINLVLGEHKLNKGSLSYNLIILINYFVLIFSQVMKPCCVLDCIEL